MLSKGIIATVNSDDPAYFGGYINENFIEVYKNLNLDNKELKTLMENSFKASFLPIKIKNKYLEELNNLFE